MNLKSKISLSETRAYVINKPMRKDKPYRGKRPNLNCHQCHNLGRPI